MLKSLKNRLYFLKVWWHLMTGYPVETLRVIEASHYDEYWRSKRAGDLSRLSDWQKMRADIALRALPHAEAGLVIGDIGSGPGSVLAYIVRSLPGARGIGYDLSALAVEHLQSLGFDGVEFDVRDPAQLSRIKAADYNLLFEIIEHVPHSEALLRAALASARRGVFVSIPNTGFVTYRLRLALFGKVPLQWRLTPDEHLRFWTLKDLHWWLRALGYGDAQVWAYQGVPFLNRLWPSLFAAGLVAYIPKKV